MWTASQIKAESNPSLKTVYFLINEAVTEQALKMKRAQQIGNR